MPCLKPRKKAHPFRRVLTLAHFDCHGHGIFIFIYLLTRNSVKLSTHIFQKSAISYTTGSPMSIVSMQRHYHSNITIKFLLYFLPMLILKDEFFEYNSVFVVALSPILRINVSYSPISICLMHYK